MQKIYRDPLYRHSKQLSFEIPDYVTGELDCDDYLESLDFREFRWRIWRHD